MKCLVAIALKMKDTASNSCEGENLQIGVSIWAAQSATKPDVFGDEYDKTN